VQRRLAYIRFLAVLCGASAWAVMAGAQTSAHRVASHRPRIYRFWRTFGAGSIGMASHPQGMSQPVDIVRSSLPNSDLLELEGIDETEDGIVLRARSKEAPQCPACSSSHVSYHSTYLRYLRDLPWQGRPVRIQFKTRRFRCLNAQCPRQIFTDRLPGVTARRARETDRLTQTLRLVGYLLGGRPGSRLLARLGMKASRDTVLRRVKKRSAPEPATKIRVLGVDDWAWRKHQKYGTILMDLEQRRVIDLLPIRSAGSFADWLRQHRGVEIIARDRCGLYAEGGRKGAPTAAQVTDRYHLMSNLSEAVEQTLQQLQIEARASWAQPASPQPFKRLTLVEARYQRCRQARYERYRAVMELSRQGWYPTPDCREGWRGGGDRSTLVACSWISGAPHPQ
jgi:transposase